jgi:hypothetical protein
MSDIENQAVDLMKEINPTKSGISADTDASEFSVAELEIPENQVEIVIVRDEIGLADSEESVQIGPICVDRVEVIRKNIDLSFLPSLTKIYQTSMEIDMENAVSKANKWFDNVLENLDQEEMKESAKTGTSFCTPQYNINPNSPRIIKRINDLFSERIRRCNEIINNDDVEFSLKNDGNSPNLCIYWNQIEKRKKEQIEEEKKKSNTEKILSAPVDKDFEDKIKELPYNLLKEISITNAKGVSLLAFESRLTHTYGLEMPLSKPERDYIKKLVITKRGRRRCYRWLPIVISIAAIIMAGVGIAVAFNKK